MVERTFIILNMRSAPAGSAAGTDDRTAKARIRDAAIARFAADGVAGTTVRAIAEDAGVSAALVIHHFGSKQRLRTACDAHVAATIRERKHAAMAAGPGLDPLAAWRGAQEGPPLLAYLARTIIDGSPEVATLVDEMVTDAAGYMAEGVETGVLRPTEYPYERAAVLTVWSLGALVLHEHLHRLLGVDLTGSAEELATATAYLAPALELLTEGLITEAASGPMREAFARFDASSADGKGTGT